MKLCAGRNGPTCPHCGSVEGIHRLEGKSHRPGLHQCNACREHFTVTVGTVMERSHVPLHKWVLAFHLMAASKKGMSAHQLHRMLKVTYKTAWFMAHRIREAMTDPNPAPIGGEGKIVEADEAYHGRKETPIPSKHRRGAPYIKRGKAAEKRAIVALVERGGEARAFHMPQVTAKNVRAVLVRHADRKSRLHTDESKLYPTVGAEFAKHETVNHSAREYARDDVTTNSARRLLRHLQARHERRLSALRRAALSAISQRVRIPLQHTGRVQDQRYGTGSDRDARCGWQAPNLPGTWFVP